MIVNMNQASVLLFLILINAMGGAQYEKTWFTCVRFLMLSLTAVFLCIVAVSE